MIKVESDQKLKIENEHMILKDVQVGKDSVIWDFVNLYNCKIGSSCIIGSFVEIQKNSEIGNCCKISSFTFICEGVTIEDNVFIGHNVTFINDLYPRSTKSSRTLQTEEDWTVIPTTVKKGSSVGSSATILAGITIGEHSIVGAGSVVTADVPANTIVAGNPARKIRGINDDS